jgi:hypothetical protein
VTPLTFLEWAAGIVIVVFLGLLGLAIVVLIAKGKISLNKLVSESNGDASMSRFQFLIFTFVIALSLFLITVSPAQPKFPDVPPDILALLGISAGSYLVSKGIQFSNPAGVTRPALVITPPATTGTVAGAAVNLTVSTANAQPGTPMPPITWSLDAPAEGTIAPGPVNSAVYTAPAPLPAAGLQATVRAKAAGFDEATATITS